MSRRLCVLWPGRSQLRRARSLSPATRAQRIYAINTAHFDTQGLVLGIAAGQRIHLFDPRGYEKGRLAFQMPPAAAEEDRLPPR